MLGPEDHAIFVGREVEEDRDGRAIDPYRACVGKGEESSPVPRYEVDTAVPFADRDAAPNRLIRSVLDLDPPKGLSRQAHFLPLHGIGGSARRARR